MFYEVSSNLGGPVPEQTIKGFLAPARLAFVLEHVKTRAVVGASLSRFPTRGVCFHALFGLSKAHQGLGLGGAMLVGGIRLLKTPTLCDQSENPYRAHKWFAAYPEYNTQVDALYAGMGWVREGTLRWHTRAKTNLTVRAFYPEAALGPHPQFWHEMHPKAPRVDDSLLHAPRTLVREQPSLFDDEPPKTEQGREGGLW